MAHHIDIRVDGVTKMANQIEEIPSFHFDGKEFIVRGTLVNEPPAPDVPKMNYEEIQQRLAAEGEADPDEQSKYDDQAEDKPRRGGRRRSQAETVATHGEETEAKKVDGKAEVAKQEDDGDDE